MGGRPSRASAIEIRRVGVGAATAQAWSGNAAGPTPRGRHDRDTQACCDERLDGQVIVGAHPTPGSKPTERQARRTIRTTVALPVVRGRLCLSAYTEAGAKRVLLWPVRDGIHHLRACAEQVLPQVSDGRRPGL